MASYSILSEQDRQTHETHNRIGYVLQSGMLQDLRRIDDMNAPRCNNHRDRADLPALCHTCQRIAVEQDIVTRTVDALLAAGYALQTDIQEDPRPERPTKDRAAILAEMMDVDDEFLGVYDQGESASLTKGLIGWVRFVYGNDGWDVISDYTTNLESVLAPINEYADTLST